MNRREYLTSGVVTGLVGMVGCLDEIPEAVGDTGEGGYREFGGVVKHRGVEVVPTHWMTVDVVTFDVDQGATLDETPATGAEFLLTRIEAANTGDHERELPSRSLMLGGPGGRNMRVYYAGEETRRVQHEDVSAAYEVDGVRLTPYTRSRIEQDATGSIYPGVGVQGWIIVQITDGFNTEETSIEIGWGGENDYEEFEWVYSAATEVLSEELDEIEGTAIEF